ncbi:MAG: hypothetical protein HY372_01415 [Candidatus Andersenbacteria bacterium]|nr:hypothetical protein [Candidatus Andersenbacteria bacterium]
MTWKPVAVVVAVAVVLLLILVILLMALSRGQKGESLVPSLPGLSQGEAASEVVPQTEYENPFERDTQYVNPFDDTKSPFDSLQQ